jgi:hypothetical protein
MDPIFFDITSYVLLILVVIVAILMARIVFSLTSKRYRERYAPKIKESFATGLTLGFLLPWNSVFGLAAALVSGIFFLLLALYSMLVMGAIGDLPLIGQTWLPRVKVRRWLSYFSMIEGVMGIINVILSIVLSVLFSYRVNMMTPLAFASIAILSDLFQLTNPEPPYRELLSLFYLYCLKNQDKRVDENYFFIEDIEFPSVLEGTDFTVYEFRESLERLVARGMAEKETPVTPMGRVRFKLYEWGLDSIKLEYEETMLLLFTEKRKITKVLDYFKDKEVMKNLDTPRKIRKALKILDKSEKESREFFNENKYFLEKDWLDSIIQRIDEQRKILKEGL